MLGHVVAHAEHERAVDARFLGQLRFDVTRPRHCLAVDQIDIDCVELLLERRRALHDLTRGVHDEGAAVEDELILATQHVHVHDGQTRILDARPYDVFTTPLILQRVRRAVDDDEQLRTGSLRGARGFRLPDVFADQQPDANAVELDDAALAAPA